MQRSPLTYILQVQHSSTNFKGRLTSHIKRQNAWRMQVKLLDECIRQHIN